MTHNGNVKIQKAKRNILAEHDNMRVCWKTVAISQCEHCDNAHHYGSGSGSGYSGSGWGSGPNYSGSGPYYSGSGYGSGPYYSGSGYGSGTYYSGSGWHYSGSGSGYSGSGDMAHDGQRDHTNREP